MSSVKTVFAEEFSTHYEFYKEYDDVVMHKENGQVFKANFKDGMVHLILELASLITLFK